MTGDKIMNQGPTTQEMDQIDQEHEAEEQRVLQATAAAEH